jgi:hypothetical protein
LRGPDPGGRKEDVVDSQGPTEVRMRIIINGAGIAGPTLAYWLRKAGHEDEEVRP